MRKLERIQRRVDAAIFRAGEKIGAECYVVFNGQVLAVKGVFLPGGDAQMNVRVGAVGGNGRFIFARDVWARISAVVGDSLDFTVNYNGEEWTPEMGAPVAVDPVAGFVVVQCYRVLLTR